MNKENAKPKYRVQKFGTCYNILTKEGDIAGIILNETFLRNILQALFGLDDFEPIIFENDTKEGK